MDTDVQAVIEKFMSCGIRLTPQRINVYKYVEENPSHPTVDRVYMALKEENPSLSKTTIYNIAEVLHEAGLLNLLRIGDGDVRLDTKTEPHAHFYCKSCKEVMDISVKDISVPKNLDGYRIDDFEVYVQGVCASCLKSGK